MSLRFTEKELKKTSTNTSKHRKFPFKITAVEPKLNTELLHYFNGERTGFVQVGPEKYFFPNKYNNEAEAYYNFEARVDDIWVASFPRSGTTWTQELVWLVANNLDFETAKTQMLTERFPFFEFSLFVHPEVKEEIIEESRSNRKTIEFVEKISQPGYKVLSETDISSRRFIKTHFPFSLLPPSVMEKQCKVIYIARNPMDVAISYYHLNRLYRTQGYTGDFARFWAYFERGLNPWAPYFSHLKEALAFRDLPNILILYYEDMSHNLSDAINCVAKFLGHEISEEGMQKLLKHLNICNLRLNCCVNGHEMHEAGILNKGESGFIRQGGQNLSNEFVDYPQLQENFQKWTQEYEKYRS